MVGTGALDGPIEMIRDWFKFTYPIRVWKVTHYGTEIWSDRGKIKWRDQRPKIKLFSKKLEYEMENLEYSKIRYNDKEFYFIYLPNDDEMYPIVPVDVRREGIHKNVEDLEMAIAEGKPEYQQLFINNLKQLTAGVWFQPKLTQSAKMGYANMLEARYNYFEKTWFEKWGNIIVPLACLIFAGMVVYFYFDMSNKQSAQFYASIPGYLSECMRQIGVKPPA